MPTRKPWDYAIELKEGFVPRNRKAIDLPPPMLSSVLSPALLEVLVGEKVSNTRSKVIMV